MPKAETFQAFMKCERMRLQKARDKAAQKKAELDQELEALERDLTAIEAYDKPVEARPRLLRSASLAAEARSARQSSRSSATIPTAYPVARS